MHVKLKTSRRWRANSKARDWQDLIDNQYSLIKQLLDTNAASLKAERKARDQLLHDAVRIERLETVVAVRTLELMKSKGLLSMRGVFGFIEGGSPCVFVAQAGTSSRSERWLDILQSDDELKDGVMRATGVAHPRECANFIADMYGALPNKPDERDERDDCIMIREGDLNERQRRVLKCICDAFFLPATLERSPSHVDRDDREQ